MPFSPLVPGKARFINCNERNLIIFLQIHGTVGKCVFIAPQYWCHNWGTLLAWVHWTAHMHNTSLQMRCVVVCLPRSLRRFYLRIRNRSRSRRALQWTGDRSCDAQFHFSRTLPPPPQPSPALAQVPPAEPRPDTWTDYLHTAQCRYGPRCSVLHPASLQFYLAAVNNRTVAWLQR